MISLTHARQYYTFHELLFDIGKIWKINFSYDFMNILHKILKSFFDL